MGASRAQETRGGWPRGASFLAQAASHPPSGDEWLDVNAAWNVPHGFLTTLNPAFVCGGGSHPTTPSGQWVTWPSAKDRSSGVKVECRLSR